MHAGLSRTALILTVTPSSTAVAAPLTAYGTSIGCTQNMWTGNDSGTQGMAWALSKDWVFHAIQIGPTAPSGYEISIYGSNDPRCMIPLNINDRPSPYVVTPTGRDAVNRLPIGFQVANGDSLAVPANSWVLLPSPSDQAGTGIDVNPITAVGQMFHAKRVLLSVRAVLTASAGAVGSLGIVVTAC
jgi:hypothetical protein